MKISSRSLVCLLTPILLLLGLISGPALSQTPHDAVKETLNNYIQGSAYNYPDLLEKAFFDQATLYLERRDATLWIIPPNDYIALFENNNEGHFNDRIGEILNIEIEGNIAQAKVEIIFTKTKLRYIDLFLLKEINGTWKILTKTASGKPANNSGDRILFIVSNAHFHGNLDKPVGASFSEIVNAYNVFKEAGYTVDFVSPEGGAIPLSYIDTSNALQKKYLYQPDFMYALKQTKKPSEIDPKRYKAVHYIGGSSAMYGVADNKAIQQISMTIYEEHNGIISSVCHGTAGIAFLKTKDGKYLVDGKRVSGFPDEYEDRNADYFKQFPFPLQMTIEDHQGTFLFSPRGKAHVEVDGRLITGQNYLSSALVAQKIIDQLEEDR